MCPGDEQADKAAHGRKRHYRQNQQDPLPRLECRIQDERHQQQSDRHDHRQPSIRALLALVFACPIQVIPLGKRDLTRDLIDRLPDGATQIAPAHTVLDRDVARVSLAIDCRRAVVEADMGYLTQSHSLARGSQNSNVSDVFHSFAVLRLVPDRQVKSLLPDQYLTYRLAAHRAFYGILYVGDIDAKPVGGGPIHHQIHVRLPPHLKGSQVGDTCDPAHHTLHFFGFLLQHLQIAAEELKRQLAFHAADSFLHVVGNRLREIPDYSRQLAQRLVHGGDYLILCPIFFLPLFSRQQVNKELRIVKPTGIAAVIGTPHLADHLCDFRIPGDDQPSLLCQVNPGVRASAGRQCPPYPNRSFIQMRKKLRPDESAESDNQHGNQHDDPSTYRSLQVVETKLQTALVTPQDPLKHRIAPFLHFALEQESAEHRRDQQ